MKMTGVILVLVAAAISFAFSGGRNSEYARHYDRSLQEFKKAQLSLQQLINQTDLSDSMAREKIRQYIHNNRIKLKAIDFWLRYFDPVAYRKLNGPLPVEWETEVFEKFEPPYKRTGAGLTLAEQWLDEADADPTALKALIRESLDSLAIFESDSVSSLLKEPNHFYLANRMFLLNLAGIYTTGYECPDTSRIIPELRSMLLAVKDIYSDFASSYPEQALSNEYLRRYDSMLKFVNEEPDEFSRFNHFEFIRMQVNPLFRLNQNYIFLNQIHSANYNDYALDASANNIFDKNLYLSQNSKGVFSFVDDPALLDEISETGRLLFYDPILSGNNKRSCASCHKPTEFFTDNSRPTAFEFDQQKSLARNAPSLVNAIYNHLSMHDGKHISLQGQAREVIGNPIEMNGNEEEIVRKVMSCKTYREAFKKFLKHTPEEKKVSLSHIVSAITYYYSGFSQYYSPFDDAMRQHEVLAPEAIRGFNLFMSKAICATCHFVPQFNGVRPPYIGSEFEVLGTPADTSYMKLSEDPGRYGFNPAVETMRAFRTGTVRNAEHTAPYMHNGVFNNLDQLIEFYDAGGGIGHGLSVPNQTLPSDSLHLSIQEKNDLKAFIHSLNEKVIFESAPTSLPSSSNRELNGRKVGGEY
ncbi:MAG: cytochrome-c peroxidase [Chitinophagaceae bacterium]